MKKGISLIVLVITIIVIIILAGAVILSISQNNPISSANEASFKQNVKNYESELSLYIAKEYTNPIYKGNYDPTTATIEISEAIKSMKAEDVGKFNIVGGKLIYIGTSNQEKIWADELGFLEKLGEGTRDKSKASYSVPYIPNNFKYLEGTVNTGYVIQDKNNGNEFVWVPVYGAILTEYNNLKNTSRDPLPGNITDDDVIKYGGFYIARYEAGLPAEYTTYDSTVKNWKDASNNYMTVGTKPVSKKGAKVWSNISYVSYDTTNTTATLIGSKDAATNMYNEDNTDIKSGLLTKAMWDATCKWLENSGYNATNISTWGNYTDNIDRTNVTPNNPANTGSHSNWKANNIYDLAGNVWEWTNETNSLSRITRGGYYNNTGKSYPVLSNDNKTVSSTSLAIGFRISLYIN